METGPHLKVLSNRLEKPGIESQDPWVQGKWFTTPWLLLFVYGLMSVSQYFINFHKKIYVLEISGSKKHLKLS